MPAIPKGEKIFIVQLTDQSSEQKFKDFLRFLRKRCKFSWNPLKYPLRSFSEKAEPKKITLCSKGHLLENNNNLIFFYNEQKKILCPEDCKGRSKVIVLKPKTILLQRRKKFAKNSKIKCVNHIQDFLSNKKGILNYDIEKSECCEGETYHHDRFKNCVPEKKETDFHARIWGPSKKLNELGILAIINLHCEPSSKKSPRWHTSTRDGQNISHSRQRTRQFYELFLRVLKEDKKENYQYYI